MKCDLCDLPAVVHETVIKNGAERSVHLCATHANERGYKLPLGAMQVIGTALAKSAEKAAGRVCSSCGLSEKEYRTQSTLGCEHCYDAFSALLERVIERAQAGATRHCGMVPNDASGAAARTAKREALLQAIQDAVTTEQYEEAARLRDQLQAIGRAHESDAPGEGSGDN